MNEHEKYRQWAALAEVGELGSQELKELSRHLAECPRCRQAASDYRHILYDWLLAHPELLESKRVASNGPRRASRRTSALRQPATLAAIAAALVMALALAWAWDRAADLEKALAPTRSSRESFREDLRAARGGVEEGSAKPEAQSLQGERDALHETIEELKEQLREAQSRAERLEEWKEAASESRTRNQTLSRRIRALQDDLEGREEVAAQLRRNVEELAGRNQALREALDQREARLASLERSLRRARVEKAAEKNRRQEVEGLLSSPSFRSVSLNPLLGRSENTGAFGRVVSASGYTSVLYLYGLDAKEGSDRRLQVWGLGRFRPVEEAAALHADRPGDGAVPLGHLQKRPSEADRWTLEHPGLHQYPYLLIVDESQAAFTASAQRIVLYARLATQ